MAEYRETFSYTTEEDAEYERASMQKVAEQHGLKVECLAAIPAEDGKTRIEITVVGRSRDITKVREIVADDTGFSSSGGGDIENIAIDLAVDLAATPTRRAWWALQRRRRGPVDGVTGSTPDA